MISRLSLFKLFRKIGRVVRMWFDHCLTSLYLYACQVSHASFYTCGVPIIDISRQGGKMTIGKNFRMNNGLRGNVIGYNTPCCFHVGNHASITIGDNVGMSQTTIVAMADVVVLNDVKGGGTKLYTTDFHSLDWQIRKTSQDRKNKKSAPITIGNDVFIGAGSIILKGVSIGDRSIVGAGSVVTRSIPPDEIWAGNPARFVRKIG